MSTSSQSRKRLHLPGLIPGLIVLALSHETWTQDSAATVTAEDIPLESEQAPIVIGQESNDTIGQTSTAPDLDDPQTADTQPGPDEPAPALSEAEQAQVIADSVAVSQYRDVIDTLEVEGGAYAQQLPEQLLGLGLSLQQQGRHPEAIDAFKRGVHLSRINDGLYGAGQLPLLEAQITSHVAQGEFEEADERQTYLYRVQRRTMGVGDARVNALMQQAQWQRQAYELGLSEYGFTRLLAMWDLYRQALTDIADREGENSPKLLEPLYGMLRSQYLIAGFSGEMASGGFTSEAFGARQEENRFNAYKTSAYKRGQSVINAIYNLNQQNSDGNKLQSARDLRMLGDWQFWHGRKEGALTTYRTAIMELAERDDAQEQTQRLFGNAEPLPNLAGVRALPDTGSPEQADLLLEFGVTAGGRVVDLDRVDEGPESSKINRLMRQLRNTRFRPRFEEGEPVDSEITGWAYDTSTW